MDEAGPSGVPGARRFDTSSPIALSGDTWDFTGGILGVGSFGSVFEAENPATGKHAAVKVIDLEPMTDWVLRQCETEPIIWAKLDHPHIPAFYGSLRCDNWLLLISESVNGGELMDHIAERAVFTEAETASVMQQLLSAVAHMHAHGVCHRDIKPQNILCAEPAPSDSVTPRWRIKLCDFGMSKEPAGGPLGVMSTPCGSMHYVAPEVRTHRYTMKVDLWAIGCIGYMLLSGAPPMGEAHTGGKGAAPTLFDGAAWEHVSSEAIRLVRSLLSIDADERPSAVEGLAHPWLHAAPSTPLLTPKILKRRRDEGFGAAAAPIDAAIAWWSCADRTGEEAQLLGRLPP